MCHRPISSGVGSDLSLLASCPIWTPSVPDDHKPSTRGPYGVSFIHPLAKSGSVRLQAVLGNMPGVLPESIWLCCLCVSRPVDCVMLTPSVASSPYPFPDLTSHVDLPARNGKPGLTTLHIAKNHPQVPKSCRPARSYVLVWDTRPSVMERIFK